ncbi:hypothetical protein [Haloarcula pelagica]|uniref:hypothetical protein n=1 Tax=Haloarcula pelagica TaxID=3033389 RepID=UPI0024C377A3|nr:hypothetical protein [Halomicroarcula sp. YJ-61-S]
MAPIIGAVGGGDATGARQTTVDTSTMTERYVEPPINDAADVLNTIQDGQLLVFPAGTFRWEETAVVTANNWGIRCNPRTKFEVPAGLGDDSNGLLLRTIVNNDVADNFLLENLWFQSPGRAAPGMRLGVETNAHVDRLHYDLDGPQSQGPQENALSVLVTEPSGTLRIDNFRQYNNGDIGGYAGGESRIGIFAGQRNQGTIHLRNPVLQGFPNNACYVSRQPGTVIVEDGLLMNNNVSAVRVSGGVEVRDTTIVIDTERYTDGPGVIDGGQHNTRGVWGDNRGAGTDGGLVTNSSFVLHNFERSSGLVDILQNPVVTVRDSQFLLDDNVIAVNAETASVNVQGSTIDGGSVGSIAGVGTILGSGNTVAPNIYPGTLPVSSNADDQFDWRTVHEATPIEGASTPSYEHTLSIWGTNRVDYELTTTGELVKGSATEGSDDVTENSDGTWTATGAVDSGDFDTYTFDGRVQSWNTTGPPDGYKLVFNGRLIVRE